MSSSDNEEETADYTDNSDSSSDSGSTDYTSESSSDCSLTISFEEKIPKKVRFNLKNNEIYFIPVEQQQQQHLDITFINACRFRDRIKELELLSHKIFNHQHRENIYNSRFVAFPS